jgi:adenosylcobinamide kinase/adenosylcobinamide-phosphate guanylyltransferase
MMKTLFIGGIKSGKSKNAEKYILNSTDRLPIYLATSEAVDEQMQEKILQHQLQRSERFLTIEEPLNLFEALKPIPVPVLIECVSMWINNMLYYKFTAKDIYEQIQKIMALQKDMVFVQNDVSTTIVSQNRLAREFTDINGIVSQMIASQCDEVYHCIAGIPTKIK